MIAEVRPAVCLGSARPCGRRVVTECFDWGNSHHQAAARLPGETPGPFPALPRIDPAWSTCELGSIGIMKLFFSSSDALEMQLGMEMLAQAAIRYALRYDPASQTEAQLWVQEDTDFPAAVSLLRACRCAAR